MKDDSGLERDGSNGSCKEWSYSDYILMEELARFADGIDAGVRKREESWMNFRYFSE